MHLSTISLIIFSTFFFQGQEMVLLVISTVDWAVGRSHLVTTGCIGCQCFCLLHHQIYRGELRYSDRIYFYL